MVRIRFDLGLECVARNLQLHRLVLLPISSSVSSSLLYRWQLNFEPLRRARVVGACDLCFMARPRPRSRQHSFFVQAGATSLEPGCACCQFLIAFPLSGPQLNYWCRSERAHGTSISPKIAWELGVYVRGGKTLVNRTASAADFDVSVTWGYSKWATFAILQPQFNEFFRATYPTESQ